MFTISIYEKKHSINITEKATSNIIENSLTTYKNFCQKKLDIAYIKHSFLCCMKQLNRRNFLKAGASMAALGIFQNTSFAQCNSSQKMSKVKFSGIMPALITPFDKNGKIMEDVVQKLIDYQLNAGVQGFYVLGGTGEGVVLTIDQRKAMVDATIKANRGRGKIIIHTGAINQNEVMEMTRYATKAGADGISSILPSIYFKYNMKELCTYYKKMADNTNLPILVYANHTGNGVDVNAMIDELLNIDNIIGAKDTRANYYQMWNLKQLNGGNINVINGPDESLLCGLTMGADGGIGTTYNVMPEIYVQLYKKFKAGDIQGAMQMQTKANKVIKVLLDWGEGYVIRTTKETLKLRGIDVGDSALPALPFEKSKLNAFKKAMQDAGYNFS